MVKGFVSFECCKRTKISCLDGIYRCVPLVDERRYQQVGGYERRASMFKIRKVVILEVHLEDLRGFILD